MQIAKKLTSSAFGSYTYVHRKSVLYSWHVNALWLTTFTALAHQFGSHSLPANKSQHCACVHCVRQYDIYYLKQLGLHLQQWGTYNIYCFVLLWTCNGHIHAKLFTDDLLDMMTLSFTTDYHDLSITSPSDDVGVIWMLYSMANIESEWVQTVSCHALDCSVHA